MNSPYYVQAHVDDLTGQFAICKYFTDADCTEPATMPLRVSASADACPIAQALSSALILIGAVFKTLGHAPVLNDQNFTPATDGVVQIVMPTDRTATKGVVLMFSDPGKVEALYPSCDPEVPNDQGDARC